MSSQFNFAPAAPEESIVYGAERPGYAGSAPTSEDVHEWVEYMQDHAIERVCCLLDRTLDLYDDLLGDYRTAFGAANVCHAPVTDFETVDEDLLFETILPFLRKAAEQNSPVVVHCSAGSGRTGHVLVAWLVCERDYTLDDAIGTVERTGRKPLEGKSRGDLRAVLTDCL